MPHFIRFVLQIMRFFYVGLSHKSNNNRLNMWLQHDKTLGLKGVNTLSNDCI